MIQQYRACSISEETRQTNNKTTPVRKVDLMDSNTTVDNRIIPLPVIRNMRWRWKSACLTMTALALVVTCIAYVQFSSNGSSDHPTVSDVVESWHGARYLVLEVYEEDSQGLDYRSLWNGATEDHLAHGVLASRCVIFDRRTIVRTSRMLEKFHYGRQYVSWAPSRVIRIYLVSGSDSVSKRTRIEMLHIDELPTLIVLCDGLLFEFHSDDPAAREWVQELYAMTQDAGHVPPPVSPGPSVE